MAARSFAPALSLRSSPPVAPAHACAPHRTAKSAGPYRVLACPANFLGAPRVRLPFFFVRLPTRVLSQPHTFATRPALHADRRPQVDICERPDLGSPLAVGPVDFLWEMERAPQRSRRASGGEQAAATRATRGRSASNATAASVAARAARARPAVRASPAVPVEAARQRMDEARATAAANATRAAQAA